MTEISEIETKADQLYELAIKRSTGLEFTSSLIQIPSTKELATQACHLYCQVLDKDQKREDIAEKIEELRLVLEIDKICSEYSGRPCINPINLYK